MTLIVSWALPECVLMLADRGYFQFGKMVMAKQKTYLADGLIISGSGGSTRAIEWFRDEMKRRHVPPLYLRDRVEECARSLFRRYSYLTTTCKTWIVVGAYDPVHKGRLFKFDTSDYVVSAVSSWTNFGGILPNDVELAVAGKHQTPGESAVAWAQRCGADLMEIGRANAERGGEFIIGGGVDLTVIDAAGARHVPLRTWKQDKIGQPLKPLRRGRTASGKWRCA